MSTRLAVSGYIGILVYSVLSLLWGPMGIRACSELEARVGKMRENLVSLERLHEGARARLEAMHTDPEILTLEARSLGYVKEGEVVVRLGFPSDEPMTPDLGTLVPYKAPNGISDAELKAVSLAAALTAFFVSLLVRREREGRAEEPAPRFHRPSRRRSHRKNDRMASQILLQTLGRRSRSSRA